MCHDEKHRNGAVRDDPHEIAIIRESVVGCAEHIPYEVDPFRLLISLLPLLDELFHGLEILFTTHVHAIAVMDDKLWEALVLQAPPFFADVLDTGHSLIPKMAGPLLANDQADEGGLATARTPHHQDANGPIQICRSEAFVVYFL